MQRHSAAIVALFTVFHLGDCCAQGFASGDHANRKHLDYAGKPCIETSASAIPLTSNRRILNHQVTLDNHCYEQIRAKVCYYRTDECTDVTVSARSRKDQIIGVFPALQDFRYEVREQF